MPGRFLSGRVTYLEGQMADAEDQQRARERGERLRAELRAKLEAGGPQSAADLSPQVPPDVSLSEVAFQLGRLAEEGDATGTVGGVYRLA
jgi:hypothetical protein